MADVLFAKAKKRGRPAKAKKVVKYNRKAAHAKYMANRREILKKQFKKYHSDAAYRAKKLKASKLYAAKRRKNGGKPFYRTGGKRSKRPNLAAARKPKRIHVPNKRVGGKTKRKTATKKKGGRKRIK